ncbi:MAG: hypothetical protein ACT4PV_11665, partial [Planctomycetaceae bacterium]
LWRNTRMGRTTRGLQIAAGLALVLVSIVPLASANRGGNCHTLVKAMPLPGGGYGPSVTVMCDRFQCPNPCTVATVAVQTPTGTVNMITCLCDGQVSECNVGYAWEAGVIGTACLNPDQCPPGTPYCWLHFIEYTNPTMHGWECDCMIHP